MNALRQIPISDPAVEIRDTAMLDASIAMLEGVSRLAHELTQRIDVQLATFKAQARECRRPFEESAHG